MAYLQARRHKYTFRNLCIEDNEILLNDGTAKLFLSTKGEVDDVSKPLKMFLDYVDGKKPEDALVQEIDHEVDTVKHCDEWRRDYMTLALEMDKKWREGKAEGKAEGKIEAIRNAIKDGLTTLAAVKKSGRYTE